MTKKAELAKELADDDKYAAWKTNYYDLWVESKKKVLGITQTSMQKT